MHTHNVNRQHAGAVLQAIVRRNRASSVGGEYAVCSAHPQVIAAAAREAYGDGSFLHIESTSSQVNQFGGYTGQNPDQFANFVREITRETGLPVSKILLGGDHLGPFPWRHEPARLAMEKACNLVRACVLAGYQKIHLDASMACADDPKTGLDEQTVADRAAVLCESAENALRELPQDAPPLLYVIGTEVPAPGGEPAADQSLSVTPAAHVEQTIKTFHQAFAKRGLEAAWERVIGLVVQPGVDFSENSVFDYCHSKAVPLSMALPASPELVYEAHSTDYQLLSSLTQMVEDHFAILKVGPELTFAFREVVFALSAIEQEELPAKSVRISKVRETLEAAMLRSPGHWRSYYHGDEDELKISRSYSYSDRCRYYWHEPEVKDEVEVLIKNLTSRPPAFTLISQYLPSEYEAIRAGELRPSPPEIIQHHIRKVLGKYASACGTKR